MNIKKIIKTTVALVIAVAIFTGCKNGLYNDIDSVQKNEGKAVVTFGLKDTASRTVNPAYTLSNLTDIKISYKQAGDSEETVIVSGKKYSDLTGGKYSAELKAGTYNFYATAKAANINLSATVENKAIVEGTNSVSFALAKSSVGTAGGTGFIDISFTVTDTDVKAVKGTLYNYSDDSVKLDAAALTLDSANKTFAYKVKEGSAIATSIEGGNYRLVLDFYADVEETLKLGIYMELVNVTDGLTSSAERTIGNLENVYSITLNLNGGTLAGGVTVPETVTRFSDSITLPTAEQMNKGSDVFIGWYTSDDFSGNAVTELSNFNRNISLYAKWGSFLSFKGNGEFSIAATKKWTGTIEYSTNKSDWNEWDGSSVNAAASGESYYIYLRGKNHKTLFDGEDFSQFSFSESASSIECNGNIMCLLDYENPTTVEMELACFAGLFKDCVKLTKAPELPAEVLEMLCYYEMFYGCSALTAAPELPAETLKEFCYYEMFKGCSALTTAPELPATTLTESCYYSMFMDCTSLETAPDLPATTLHVECYRKMFEGCTSLETAPALSAATVCEYSYCEMFKGCTSLKNVPESLPAQTLDKECYEAMFSGCTALETAPALPATSLSSYCYKEMFSGCTALKNVPDELPATTLVYRCYYSMFKGCSSLESSPVIKATTIADGCCYRMFYGCTSLTNIGKISITGVVNNESLFEMFKGCSSLKVLETSDADKAFITFGSIANSVFVKDMFAETLSGFSTPTEGKSYKYVVTTPIDGDVSIDWGGHFKVGTTLEANYSGNAGDSITYQWYRYDYDNDSEITITGATSKNYTLVAEDDGMMMFVVVTGTGEYTESLGSGYTYSKVQADHRLDWKDKTVFDEETKTVREKAQEAKEIIFGKVSVYSSAVSSLTKVYCGIEDTDAVMAYFDSTDKKLYVLAADDIIFPDDMSYGFEGCSEVALISFNNINTINVNSINSMFNGCTALTSLDLSGFNTANVNDMNSMFNDCTSLLSLDLSGFNTAYVNDMSNMFSNCTALTSLDLSDFDISNVMNMNNMFDGCSTLTTIYVSDGTDWSGVEDGDAMFDGCVKIEGGNGTTYSGSYIDKTYARVDGLNGDSGYFTVKPTE